MTSIRLVTLDDAATLGGLVQVNREFLAPWQPVRDGRFFTRAGQGEAIRQALREYEFGRLVPHVILDRDRIVGRITLSNIVRGSFESCHVGYWVGAADNSNGHATAAVGLIAEFAFGEMRLHRIEAGTLPHNVRSRRVLERNGFERIGLAPAYLQIAGRWQDHILFQKLNPAADGGR